MKVNMCIHIISRKDALSYGLKKYFTGIPCIHGHLSQRTVTYGCIECARIKAGSKKQAEYSRKYRTTEKCRNRKKLNYQKHKNSILAKRKAYRRNNPDKEFIRRSIERLNSSAKFSKTDYEKLLGYSRTALRNHIQSLFSEGMSWSNYGEWHIDHIKPVKIFLEEGVTDIKIVNNLSNLQPLWAKDNLSKGCRFSNTDNNKVERNNDTNN